MATQMPDSRLNEAERHVQRSFMKSNTFNELLAGCLAGAMVFAAYFAVRDMPDRRPAAAAVAAVRYQAVRLGPVAGPLRIAGAWRATVPDRRFGGLSALAIDRGQFVTVSDLGAVVRLDPPSADLPQAHISDLGAGPGDPRFKTSRDAEALMRDPAGRGWWVAYEQRHSLWRYDDNFEGGSLFADLDRPDWKRNRGVEGMVNERTSLLLVAENGREAVRVQGRRIRRIAWVTGMEVADAASAPDGTHWLLLRNKGIGGISQAIAPLVRTATGYHVGTKWRLPKAPLDNYEGMVIAARPGGGWRFWLVTDDGHRIMARTLLVALDLDVPPDTQTPGDRHRTSHQPQ